MLQLWMKQNEKATVKRLQFELDQVEMTDASRYIGCLSSEATCKVVVPLLTLKEHLKREVTVYDLQRFAELCEQKGIQDIWGNMNKSIRAKAFTLSHNPGNASQPPFLSWISCTDTLGSVLERLESDSLLKPIVKKFKSDIEDGLFEPKSEGGVTYS